MSLTHDLYENSRVRSLYHAGRTNQGVQETPRLRFDAMVLEGRVHHTHTRAAGLWRSTGVDACRRRRRRRPARTPGS